MVFDKTIAPKSAAATSPVGRTRRLKVIAHLGCLAVLIAVPLAFADNSYLLSIFNRIFSGLMITFGMFVILGLSKQFSLCQVAIYGIGAYAMANLTANAGMSFLPALLLSGAMSATIGALIAVPGARFQGPWLALVTFAFAEIARILMGRLKSVTGGSAGFSGIPQPNLFGLQIDTEYRFYFVMFVAVVLAYFVVLALRYSPVGRIWLALGDNPDIADSVGVNVFRYRILAFAVGSFIAGLAGALFASYAGFISPESFGFSHTVYYLTVLVVGGLESLVGAIISVVVFELLHDSLMAYYPWDLIVDGVIIIVFVNFLPRGIGSISIRRMMSGGLRKRSARA